MDDYPQDTDNNEDKTKNDQKTQYVKVSGVINPSWQGFCKHHVVGISGIEASEHTD